MSFGHSRGGHQRRTKRTAFEVQASGQISFRQLEERADEESKVSVEDDAESRST